MTFIAQFSLELSLILALYAGIIMFFTHFRKSDWLVSLGYKAGIISSILINLSSLILLYALVTKNFSLEYVASYTSSVTPLFYRITAFWAGQAGSLLFWALILSWYVLISYKRDKRNDLYPIAFGVMMFVMVFFIIAVTLIKSPFKVIPFKIPDGQGLNPLLQNVGMAYHPPTLFLGYVGLAVPFAYMVSMLVSRKENTLWLGQIRFWLLVPWTFLGIGIVLGAQWAYVELGWGGYWAWDPVENASLLPWLTGTAAIHSIYAQRKKGYFKIWNFLLISITFLLSIFGTFLTRSGIVASVHTFSSSVIGMYFFGFILFLIAAIFILIMLNWKYFKNSTPIERFISREGSILLNNIIFLGMTFAILWGTMYPLISRVLQGQESSVGVPFYNQIIIPIGLVMIFLMSCSPFIRWSEGGLKRLSQVFLIPFIFSAIPAIGLIIAGGVSIYVILSFSLILFAAVLIFQDFYSGIKGRRGREQESIFTAIVRLFQRNRTRYGGHLVHLGVLMLYIGFTGSAFNQEFEGKVKIGDKNRLGPFELELVETRSFRGANYDAIEASLVVRKGESVLGVLKPEKRLYDKFRDHVRSEVSIITGLYRDIYGILVAIVPEEDAATVKILINPLVIWIWIGSFVLTLGAVIVILPGKKSGNAVESKDSSENHRFDDKDSGIEIPQELSYEPERLSECPECATEVFAEDRFCRKCGALLE